MAEVVFLQFRSGRSVLHRMDVRLKLLSLILLSATCFAIGAISLLVLLALTTTFVVFCRLPLKQIARGLKPFLWLFVLIMLARALSTPGTPLLSLGLLTASGAGIAAGAVFCLRLLNVVLISSLLSISTTVSQLRSGVEWLLRPLPLVPEHRVAAMMGLAVGFIPLVFVEAQRISVAQKARCVENIRNPVRRITTFSFAALRCIFNRVDGIANAMQARGYPGAATPSPLHCRSADWLWAGVVLSVCVGLYALAI